MDLSTLEKNVESIAFYGGEENEVQLLLDRFRRAFENLSELLIASRNLGVFTNGYRYLIQILPAAIVSPMYFTGKIEFGVINQSVSAFNHILSDFSLIVFQFQSISAFSVVIDRLGEFDDLLDGNEPSLLSRCDSIDGVNIIFKSSYPYFLSSNGSLMQSDTSMVLEIRNLTLLTPRSGNVLITDLTMELKNKDHLLVMGPSGSGKTSLLRAWAGLWTSGTGGIIYHVRVSMQLQTSNLGTDEPTNTKSEGEELLQSSKQRRDNGMFFVSNCSFLRGLKKFIIHQITMLRILCSKNGWASVLSLGEQQRLAFARLLLAKPTLVLLEESTSALDDTNQAHKHWSPKNTSQVPQHGPVHIEV